MADARDKLLVKLTDTCVELEKRVARLEAAACVECRRNMSLGVLAEMQRNERQATPKRGAE